MRMLVTAVPLTKKGRSSHHSRRAALFGNLDNLSMSRVIAVIRLFKGDICITFQCSIVRPVRTEHLARTTIPTSSTAENFLYPSLPRLAEQREPVKELLLEPVLFTGRTRSRVWLRSAERFGSDAEDAKFTDVSWTRATMIPS
jgi:hypothetical protein